MIEQALQRLWYERIMPAMASIVTGLVFHSRIKVGSTGQGGRSVLSHDIEGQEVEGQDSQGQPIERAQMDARAAEVAGFAVVPMAGEPALALGWGANLAVIPLASEKYRPKGLKAGETAIYNLRGRETVTDGGMKKTVERQAVIKLDEDGSITLIASSWDRLDQAQVVISRDGSITVRAAAGKDVTVNGGTLKIARETDPVDATASMATWIGGVQTALAQAAAGGPITVPAAPASFGVIKTGAAHFKG